MCVPLLFIVMPSVRITAEVCRAVPALLLLFCAVRAQTWYAVVWRSPVNVGLSCQPLVGATLDVDVVIAY